MLLVRSAGFRREPNVVLSREARKNGEPTSLVSDINPSVGSSQSPPGCPQLTAPTMTSPTSDLGHGSVLSQCRTDTLPKTRRPHDRRLSRILVRQMLSAHLSWLLEASASYLLHKKKLAGSWPCSPQQHTSGQDTTPLKCSLIQQTTKHAQSVVHQPAECQSRSHQHSQHGP